MAKSPKKLKRRRRRRRFLKCILGMLLLTLGLFALLTPPGLALLTPVLERAASNALRVDTRISGLELRWPLEVRMEKLEGHDDDDNLRISMQRVRVRLSLRQLLRRKLRIYEVSAREVSFAGLPEPAEPRPARTLSFPLDLPDVPAALDAVEIHRAVIRRLELTLPGAPESVWTADASLLNRRLEGTVSLQRLDGRTFISRPSLALDARVDEDAEGAHWALAARFTGFAGLLDGWPAEMRDAVLLDLELAADAADRRLSVRKGELRSALLRIQLAGNLDLDSGLSDFLLLGEVPELELLRGWSPVPLDGKVNFQFQWAGLLTDPDWDLQVFTEEIGVADRRLAFDLHCATGLRRLTQGALLEGSLRVDGFPLYLETGFTHADGEIMVPGFRLTGEGFRAEAHAAYEPEGRRLSAAWDLSVDDLSHAAAFAGLEGSTGRGSWAGEIRLREGEGTLRFSAFEWALNGLELAAPDPLQVRLAPASVEISPWMLQVGEGKLALEGGVDGDRLNLEAGILNFPMTLFGFIPGLHPDAELEGGVTLQGTPEKPEIGAWLTASGLRPADARRWDGEAARFRTEVQAAGGRVTSRFRLSGLPGDPVELKLDLPLELSLRPFHFAMPMSGEVNGSLRADTDLAGLGRLFVLDVYHRLSGRLQADVSLAGRLEAPHLEGGIQLRDGRYEHELSGTVLRNVILEVRAERDFFELVNFTARDGGEGEVRASGRLAFSPADRYPFEVDLTLNRFRLANNDEVRAYGRGSLTWKGNLEASALTGELGVHPVELNIPENLPPRLYALEVVEIFGHEDEGMTAVEPEPAHLRPRHRIQFDVRLNAPDRIFVRGRGLDSEWSARIRIRGQTPDPLVEGRLTLVRGRFQFFGRRLVLNRGVVTFDGGYPPVPLLDVEAQASAGGVTAILRVQGPADDPIIELDGSPPMPEDEILARLLFGREAARITPWQAVTLAQAVNQLRGGGNAFDLMGETRRVLRVDQIDVRTPDEDQEGTTVTVGKYISDRVYLELERNIGAETGGARVEVELTPSFRLETQTGGDRDTGIGLIWTRDF